MLKRTPLRRVSLHKNQPSASLKATQGKKNDIKPNASSKKNFNVEINDSFQKALDVMEHGTKSVFVTGRAGTGKSTLLEYFREHTKKKIVVLAPTGVAALNVRGQTIHSFFKFKPGITPATVKRRADKEQKNIYEELHAIVIDEISMVRADLLDCVDRALRLNRDRKAEPFGGVQMIFIGDLYQLPPVVGREEEEMMNEYYGSPYFFSARSLADVEFETVELEKIYRQKDLSFIKILNAVRDNSIGFRELEDLNARHIPGYKHKPGSDFSVYLAPTNRKVAEINEAELKRLAGTEFSYKAKTDGDFQENQFPTEGKLRLKVGAQIMMLNNDIRGRWVNGSIGKIVSRTKDFNGDILEVKLNDGDLVQVEPFTWEIYQFYVNDSAQIVPEAVGSFRQYPLKLAWAVTIHKSQGKTFEKVVLDIDTGTFAHGQTYVALSRCTSLEGLTLAKKIEKRHIIMDRRIVEFMRGGGLDVNRKTRLFEVYD
ncbi:MAG: AAA family ATPase [Candidatus Paceibacterota bacterium]|jgi:ATP-dependent exoDNAse (exonuclease V) alpha subunit|nr:AAA family ATPase [Candidatus Paceibacterota bacterium]